MIQTHQQVLPIVLVKKSSAKEKNMNFYSIDCGCYLNYSQAAYLDIDLR